MLAPESGPLRAVHLSRYKWPGGLVNYSAPPSGTPSQTLCREFVVWGSEGGDQQLVEQVFH